MYPDCLFLLLYTKNKLQLITWVTWYKHQVDVKFRSYKHMGCYFGITIQSMREYGSTLYVGLARAVSPTNTNFRLTFLLTRLQEALYEDLAV